METEDSNGALKSSHTISCAILSLSRQLLSFGLLDVMKRGALDSVKQHGKALSSRQLAELSYRVIVAQRDSVLRSLDQLISDYCGIAAATSFDLGSYLKAMVSGEILSSIESSSSSSVAELSACSITRGKHGRMLQTQSAIGRGHIAMREKPFISVCKSSCRCHDHVILSEYVSLAWVLAMIMHLDKNLLHFKSVGEILCGQVFDCLPLSSQQKEYCHDFLASFRSGLGADVLSEWDLSSDISSTEQALWSMEVQATMAIASSLCSLYTEHIYCMQSLDEAVFRIDSSTIFEIMSRIPMNVHAVFYVQGSTDGTSPDVVVEQQRQGFALFLRASCVNHSCSPNATIRYVQDDHAFKRERSQRDILEASRIEVIPLRSIAAGEEITICYGPSYGIHSYNTRHECLMTQYLFYCRCKACEDELRSQQLMVESSPGSTAKDIDHSNAKSNIHEVVRLCENLDRSLEQVQAINDAAVSLLLSKPSHELLLSFYEESLSPLQQHLMVMKMRHFSISDDLEAAVKPVKIKRVGFEKDLFMEFAGVYTTLLDIMARVLAAAGKFLLAADSVKEAVALLIESGRFQPDDVAIGRERIKLAQLYFNAGDFLKAVKHAKRGLRTIEAFVHKEDPDLLEGRCLLRYLSQMKL
jgi:hypothetical protein